MYKRKNPQTAIQAAIASLDATASAGESMYPTHSTEVVVAGVESLNPTSTQDFHDEVSNLTSHIEAALVPVIASEIGIAVDELKAIIANPAHPSYELIDSALQAGTDSFMARGSEQVLAEYINPSNTGENVLGDTGDVVAANESFDKNDFTDFVTASATYNTIVALSDPFGAAFFRPKMVPAGKSGLDVVVPVPRVYPRTVRNKNGKVKDQNKKTLLQALRDNTILRPDLTELVPVAKPENDAFLTDEAVIGNIAHEVNGETVNIRPIAPGKKVDLLGLSDSEALVSGEQDETDTLDPNLGLGQVFVKVTNPEAAAGSGASAVIRLGTKGMQGALFTRPAEGSGSDLTVNFNGSFGFTNETKNIAGADLAVLELEALLGGPEFVVEFGLAFAGAANSDNGSFVYYVNEATALRAAIGTDTPSPVAEATVAKLVFEVVGCFPSARRSNTNMRNRGQFIESSHTKTFRLPVRLQSPLTTQNPVGGEGKGASVETLTKAAAVRRSNIAVSTLLETFDIIKAGNGLSGTSAMAGAAVGITPTAYEAPLDLSNAVISMRSNGSYDDLREAVLNSITTMANRINLDSGYSAALKVTPGSNEYEIVVGTDPYIEGLVMKSGELRTLGQNAKIRVVSSEDITMRNTILIGFRRVGSDPADPLNIGVNGMVPAMIYKAQSSVGNTNRSEIQVQPRDTVHVLCPVMAKINVTGTEDLFVNTTPRIG